ncbi:hypothetical protein KXV70_006025, partial [Aspergillus fumigatus]
MQPTCKAKSDRTSPVVHERRSDESSRAHGQVTPPTGDPAEAPRRRTTPLGAIRQVLAGILSVECLVQKARSSVLSCDDGGGPAPESSLHMWPLPPPRTPSNPSQYPPHPAIRTCDTADTPPAWPPDKCAPVSGRPSALPSPARPFPPLSLDAADASPEVPELVPGPRPAATRRRAHK